MLTQDSLIKIDNEIAKYPKLKQRSAIIAALRIAQDEHTWLSKELIEYVANYLNIPPIQALEVATFYTMFNTKPVGKYKITICTNLPCALRGSIESANYLKNKLGIEFNETTPDKKYTLVKGECMGACGEAPVLLINNHKMCSFMTPKVIDEKLLELE